MSLLVPFIFSMEELEAASGLAVLGDAFSPACAAFVTQGGPVKDGIDSNMFECLTDVLILQPDSACQQMPTADEIEGAGGGNQLQLYHMQRLHREAAGLLLTLSYQEWVEERVQQWVQVRGYNQQQHRGLSSIDDHARRHLLLPPCKALLSITLLLLLKAAAALHFACGQPGFSACIVCIIAVAVNWLCSARAHGSGN